MKSQKKMDENIDERDSFYEKLPNATITVNIPPDE